MIHQMMENTVAAVATTDVTIIAIKRIKVAAEISKTIWLVIPISRRKTRTKPIRTNQMPKAKRKAIYSGMGSNGCQDKDRRLTSIRCRSIWSRKWSKFQVLRSAKTWRELPTVGHWSSIMCLLTSVWPQKTYKSTFWSSWQRKVSKTSTLLTLMSRLEVKTTLYRLNWQIKTWSSSSKCLIALSVLVRLWRCAESEKRQHRQMLRQLW